MNRIKSHGRGSVLAPGNLSGEELLSKHDDTVAFHFDLTAWSIFTNRKLHGCRNFETIFSIILKQEKHFYKLAPDF